MMSLILGSLVLGVLYFAHRILAVPYESETPTVISQVASTIVVIALLAYGNLRGVKEAGRAFALPTYLFAGSMFVVFGIGIYRELTTGLPQLNPMAPGAIEIGAEQGLLSAAAIFILLRAFANGGSSLTGLEAIADGVGLFKTPESVNAKKTLVMMSLILGSLVLGVSYFAQIIVTGKQIGRAHV